MSAGRTNFFPKDTGWWRRERIVEAGLRHGTLATSVMDWLTCEAKAQNPKPVSDGYMKTGYVAIAHGATFGHNDAAQVREVVATLVEVGLLDDFEETGMTFTCRISGWKKDVVDKLDNLPTGPQGPFIGDVPRPLPVIESVKVIGEAAQPVAEPVSPTAGQVPFAPETKKPKKKTAAPATASSRH